MIGSVKICIEDRYVRKDGKCKIFVRVTINKKKRDIPVPDVYISPKYFDYSSREILKHKSDEILSWSQKNFKIDDVKKKCEDILMYHTLQNIPLSINQFEETYNNGIANGDLIAFIDKQLKKYQKKLDKIKAGEELPNISKNSKVITYVKASTLRQYKSSIKKLKAFQSCIYYSELDFDFRERYDLFLVEEYNNDTNTRWKDHKILKKFVNLAKKNKARIPESFYDFKISITEGDIIDLNEDEIMQVMSLYNEFSLPPHIQETLSRYLFSFMCCGLRLSDTHRVSWEHYENGIIAINPQKGERYGRKLVIPLIEEAYRFIHNKSRKGLFFNKKSDHQIWLDLKEVARCAGIKKGMSFHTARHTFATIYLNNGGQVQDLQHLMGHAKIETTLRYFHLTESRKVHTMSKFDELMKSIIQISNTCIQ